MLYAAAVAFVTALHAYCDWALNRKLICLYRPSAKGECGDAGNQICVLGEVGAIEIVGEGKSNVEKVDNDYCINLILAPIDIERHRQMALATGPNAEAENTARAENGPQAT